MGRPSKYPAEFQTEAVRLVLTTDKPMAEVARDLGVNYKTLGNWVRKAREQHTLDALPGALSEHERLELKRLRRRSPICGSSARSSAKQPRISPRRRPGEPLPVRLRTP